MKLLIKMQPELPEVIDEVEDEAGLVTPVIRNDEVNDNDDPFERVIDLQEVGQDKTNLE